MTSNNINVSNQVSVQRPSVNTVAEFKEVASGVAKRQQMAFDGKVQPQDVVKSTDSVKDTEALTRAVETIASYAESLGRSLAISVDDRSGDFIVRVQNASTEELVRQIPSEEVLAISQAIKDSVSKMDIPGADSVRGLLLKTSV
jgi:flagellar protein FlaG